MSEATATKVETGKWTVDPVHSNVGFETTHMVVSKFRGSFGDLDVTLDAERETPRLAGSVRVSSVETRLDDISEHLQGPDFFDAANHPEITFGGDIVDVDGDGNVRVEGELTMRGVTKPVVLTGTYRYIEAGLAGTPVIGLGLETTVNRHDYGISWNAPLPSGGLTLADDVKLRADLELGPVADEG